MLSRHEAELSATLAECGAEKRAVFAASCATRLFPAVQPQGESGALGRDALDRLWRHLSGQELSVEALNALAARVEAAVPHEDEVEVWTASVGLEGNALAAIAYALLCAATGDPQHAVWAARQPVEALDLHAEQVAGVADAGPASASYPGLERELARQDRTIAELAVVERLTGEVVEGIRQDATGAAEDFWDS